MRSQTEGLEETNGKSKRSKPVARWGWDGVNEKLPVAHSENDLLRVIDRLPVRTSPIDAIRNDLVGMSVDYRSHLRQDEFGPTRADRARALEIVVTDLGAVLSRLKSLHSFLRPLLSDELVAFCSPAEPHFKIDILELHTADKHSVEAIAAAADKMAQHAAARFRGDPYLIGYFVDKRFITSEKRKITILRLADLRRRIC